MLAFVEVTSDEVDFREGRNEKGYWSIRRQNAFMHQGDVYPTPFEISLEEKQNPYPAGRYVLAGGSFRLGKFGLELGRNIKLLSSAEALSRLSDVNKPVRPGSASGVAA